jgi:hypothetical protein
MKTRIIIFLFVLFIFCHIQATPVRIVGMGMLDLIVDDESNRINLFDYGLNIGALYDDERYSSLESYIVHGNVSYSDSGGERDPKISYWGINLPSSLAYSIVSLSYLEGVPTGASVTYRTDKEIAVNVSGFYSKAESEYETANREDYISMPIGGLIFSKRFGSHSGGIGGGFTKISLTNNQDESEVSGSLKGLEIGWCTNLTPMFDMGISGGFGLVDGKADIFGFESTVDGNAIQVGVQGIVKVPGLLRVGMKFNFINSGLDAETSAGNVTVDAGDIDFSEFEIGSRLLFSSMLMPFSLGAHVDYSGNHPVTEDANGNRQSDVSNSNFSTGVGVSYGMPYFTPGIQFTMSNSSREDKVYDISTSSGQWDIRIGGEVVVTPVAFRAGFIMGKTDPDKDTSDDELSRRSITAGTGLQLPYNPLKFEFAFINTVLEPVDDPEENRTTDNALNLALKMNF